MQAHRIGQLGAVALFALPTQAFAQIATPAPPIPELLRVTRTDDNGEGSLRWAIERNNAAPGRFRIEIDPAGQAPYVIKPASALPPIKGPGAWKDEIVWMSLYFSVAVWTSLALCVCCSLEDHLPVERKGNRKLRGDLDGELAGVRQLCPEGVFTSAPAGSDSNRTAAVGLGALGAKLGLRARTVQAD